MTTGPGNFTCCFSAFLALAVSTALSQPAKSIGGETGVVGAIAGVNWIVGGRLQNILLINAPSNQVPPYVVQANPGTIQTFPPVLDYNLS